jgi:autotransporter family porin
LTNSATIAFSSTEGKQFKTLTTQNYAGNEGMLIFNTELGNDSSLTDRLVITGNSSGQSNVSVNNIGGNGAQTIEGIELISVGGKSDAIFTKSGRIAAGAYDYDLQKKDKNWYLTSAYIDPVEPPVTPVEPSLAYRPETGSYTANLMAANTLFNHSLHDRLGETQYTDILTGEKKVTSLWLRNEGGHQRSKMADGQNKTQANRYVAQLGGDLAQWTTDGFDRYHLGAMVGYANQKSRTHSSLTGYSSRGNIDGYSTGVYGTWYANEADKSGFYVDSWLQYSWFNNTVNGELLHSEKYKSRGFTASVESGYSFLLSENKTQDGMSNSFWIQPQAQLIWMGVKDKNHTEDNGTLVQGKGQNNIQTRLGAKAYLQGAHVMDEGKNRTFQPFVEASWIHNTKNFGVTMDSTTVTMNGTKNIGELKTGVEGQISKNINLWGDIAQQIGDNSYSDTQVSLGVKYLFK